MDSIVAVPVSEVHRDEQFDNLKYESVQLCVNETKYICYWVYGLYMGGGGHVCANTYRPIDVS